MLVLCRLKLDGERLTQQLQQHPINRNATPIKHHIAIMMILLESRVIAPVDSEEDMVNDCERLQR